MQFKGLFVSALVSFAVCSQSFALTPPRPEPVGKIVISEGYFGAYTSNISSLQYDNKRLSIFFIGGDDQFEFASQQPVAGKSADFIYEKFGSYKCSGTAYVKSVEYDNRIATVIGAVPLVNKLTLTFSKGICKYTDGLAHPMIFIPLVGSLEYSRVKDTGNCTDLQGKINSLQLENLQLRKKLDELANDSDDEQLAALYAKIDSLQTANTALTAEVSAKEADISEIRKLVNKTKPNNFSSLKLLYNNLKKKLLAKENSKKK